MRRPVQPRGPMCLALCSPLMPCWAGSEAHPAHWSQVWEQNSGVIIMLTRNVEAGVLKCSEYFPATVGASQTYGESRSGGGQPCCRGGSLGVCALCRMAYDFLAVRSL